MKIWYKITLVSLLGVIAIMSLLAYSLFQYVGNYNQNELKKSSNYSQINLPSYNYKNSSINLQDPILQERYIESDGYGLKFILYEDFPIRVEKSSTVGPLRLINLPDNAWAKFVIDENQTTLRLSGYVMPHIMTPFNHTLFLVPSNVNYDIHPSDIAVIPLVKNQVLEKINVLRTVQPVKFGEELTSYPNSTLTHIFGIVYDNTYSSSLDSPNLQINIESIGITHNTDLTGMPEWLKVEIMKMPLILKPNEPDYYAIKISTVNAKPGSYQIAFREKVNDQTFLEMMTLNVLPQESVSDMS